MSDAFLTTDCLIQAALWYGFVVHLRIYPIVYALPIILVLDPLNFQSSKKPVLTDWSARKPQVAKGSSCRKLPDLRSLWSFFTSMFTWRRLMFGFISATVFFVSTGFFFYLFGWEFLNEALLYHLTRTDPRHNFSIYFYHIYLNYERDFSILEKLISFLPQIMVQLALIFCFAQDFPFCFFVQTVAFVAFNKVCEHCSIFFSFNYPLNICNIFPHFPYKNYSSFTGHNSSIFCLVFLPIALDTAMD